MQKFTTVDLLRDIKTVKPVSLNLPTLKGAANNPGIA